MKRLSFLIGLLPLLLPLSARALSPMCEQVLGNPDKGISGIPAVSPYVRQVLERSNAGITYAKDESKKETGGEFTVIPSAAQTVAILFRSLVDVQLTLTEQVTDLTQVSACRHADVIQIQCQLDKVRDEILAAFKAGKPALISQLEPQIPFLKERLEYLNRGADDPSFADPTWGALNPIDPPSGDYWCCADSGDTCTQSAACVSGGAFYSLDGCLRGSKCKAPVGQSAEGSRTCPFSSDYGPAVRTGYGCDASIMNPRAVYGTIVYERDTLQYLLDQVRRVGTELGGTTPPAPSHKVVNGCMRKYGYCTEDRYVACAEDVDCIEANAGTCAFDLPEDASWQSVGSPFSLMKDNLGIIAKFLRLRAQQGYSRLPSNDLKNTSEFSGQQSSERDERADEGAFQSMFRGAFRLDFSNWSRVQGREEVGPFIQSTDAQQAMAAALPFSGVGKRLKAVVTDMNGIRGFLAQYAYFARRTCINRPCSMKLEQILRMTYTDACFPFADGTYKNDSLEDPQWKKCAQEACIPVEGVTLDAGKCVCYRVNAGSNLEYNPVEVEPGDKPDVCVPR
jgi:hypothetical protein